MAFNATIIWAIWVVLMVGGGRIARTICRLLLLVLMALLLLLLLLFPGNVNFANRVIAFLETSLVAA
jgi:hypothetical protein